jgi:Fur family ferric uptake transcriptional regulator
MAQQIVQKLSEKGYRLTPQRGIILSVLSKSEGHISAEDIYRLIAERHPCINISTVYRTLELLLRLGMIVRADMGDGLERYQCVDKSNHHHLVCSSCGRIIEVEENMLEEFQQEAKRRYGFDVQKKHLAFSGLCKDCRRR